MRVKSLLIVILILYAGYYICVSKGFIKKPSAIGQGGFVARAIDAVTPMSPEERRGEANERLDFLKMQLAVAVDNLENYEKWRANAISNPPS